MWRKNMLAVCVDDKPRRKLFIDPIKEGEIYRVIKVARYGHGLHLEGLADSGGGFWADRFRPAALDWQTETQTNSVKIADLLRVSA